MAFSTGDTIWMESEKKGQIPKGGGKPNNLMCIHMDNGISTSHMLWDSALAAVPKSDSRVAPRRRSCGNPARKSPLHKSLQPNSEGPDREPIA